MEFKGFDDWVPIFRGGQQTDSAGRVHNGNALIDRAVSTFNVSRHEPPVVVGHPADNAPAFGWVDGLQKQGNLLMARFKQVQPAFADMVRQGLFKKRSAAFYPDGSLRHVGFLGAMPPAVKGLPDIGFDEGECTTFEFNEETEKEEVKMPTFKEKLNAVFNELIGKMPDEGPATVVVAPVPQFSEADIEAIKKAAAETAAKEEREKVASEFAEKARVAAQDARKATIASWCDRMVKEGKMTPAMVKYGVPEFMTAFAEREDVLEFGETKDKATLFDRFCQFWETEMPKVVTFGEVARRDQAMGGGNAGGKLAAMTAQRMKENKELTYSAAFAEVQGENPDLAREYHQEIGG